jgi:uncharacterized tellurite resistance protein B-like protein
MENFNFEIGKGLMIVAGSDKEISKPEMEWLENTWLCDVENADSIYDLLVRFNYREESKEDFFRELGSKFDDYQKKKFIYDAVNMASSDDIYSKEEKECISQLSDYFEIESEVISAIESLVEMEMAVKITKSAILNKP